MIGDAQKWKKNPKCARVFSASYHFSSHTTTAQSNVEIRCDFATAYYGYYYYYQTHGYSKQKFVNFVILPFFFLRCG